MRMRRRLPSVDDDCLRLFHIYAAGHLLLRTLSHYISDIILSKTIDYEKRPFSCGQYDYRHIKYEN